MTESSPDATTTSDRASVPVCFALHGYFQGDG